jgi:hypothetical protein
MYIIMDFFVEFYGNREDNNENNIAIQSGLILKNDGRHKAVQSIIVIC